MGSTTPRAPRNHRVVLDVMRLHRNAKQCFICLFNSECFFFTNLGFSALLQKLEVCLLSQKVKAKNCLMKNT